MEQLEAPTPRDQDLRARATRGVAWVAIERWGSRLLQIAVLIVLVRFLEPGEVGVVALVAALVGLLGALAEFGLGAYIQSAPTVTRELESTAFWLNFALSVSMVLLASVGATFLVGDDFIRRVLLVSVLVLPVTALASVPTALLLRELNTRPLAARRLVGEILGAVVGVVSAVLGAGAWALVAQLMTASVVSTSALLLMTKWRPRLYLEWSRVGEILGFGSRVFGSRVTNQLRDRSDDFIIAGLLGTVSLGIWTTATRLARAVADVTSSVILSVSLSTLSSVAHDPPRLNVTMRSIVASVAAVNFPVMGLLAVLAGPVIDVTFGSRWAQAAGPAQLITIALAIHTVQWLDGSFWFAVGRPRVEFRLSVGILVFHVALIGGAAVLFDGNGDPLKIVALAYLARVLMTWPVRMMVANRVGGLPLSTYSDLPGIVLATAGAMAVAAVVQNAILLGSLVSGAAAGTVGLAVYFGGLRFIRPELLRGLVEASRSLSRRTSRAAAC